MRAGLFLLEIEKLKLDIVGYLLNWILLSIRR